MIPAFLKIFFIFGLILLLIRVRLTLSLSLFLGALSLGLWMGQGPVAILQSAYLTITGLTTISLVLIVGLILIMSRLMKETGHMDRLVTSFARFSNDARLVGVVMSALIGLLPMPGGALFSAPIVGTSLNKHAVTDEQKAIMNYWFRHIWEYWWPLYPGVVLAVALLGVETWYFITVMAPMTLLSLLAGSIFVLRPIKKIIGPPVENISWQSIRSFLWEMMPILIVIIIIMILPLLMISLELFGVHLKIPGAVSILPGLLVSMIWVWFINRVSFDQFRSAVLNRTILPMLLLIVAIMVFQGIMVSSGAVVQIRNELIEYHIPVMLVIMIMPFISGLITGIAIGFVGTSFPLIIPMFPAGQHFEFMTFAAIAYTFGYMGMMLSPVHLCFLVTKDYFHAGFLKSYRLLIRPVLAVTITAVLLFFFIQAL